jgi:hypothetical protein
MEHIPAEQHTKAIDIRLSGEAIEGWRKSPRPHHGRHHATWARVALAIQWIMRRWNSALHMSSPEGVADVGGTIQVLMYNCFRPWSENVRSELSYDVLDERVMRHSFEKAAKRLVTALQQIAEVLEKTGQSELASEYRGPVDDIHLHAARLADRAFRSKSVRGMLAAEGAILNGLMRYSQDVKAADSPRDIRQVADALVTVFNDQMPRIFKGKPAEHLAAAIFLEATAAMHIAVGGAPPMEVRIQSADGTWFDNNRQPISDAA